MRASHGNSTSSETARAARGGDGGDVSGSRIRLTRRGRWVLKALVIGVLGAGAMVGLGADPAVVAAPSTGQGQSEVVVRPGDTLWSVARRHEPQRDPLATVEEIRELNDLPDYTVHPGQTLLLP